MRYLHTMVRVRDLEESLDFYCNKLGLIEVRRYDNEGGRFTLVFLAAAKDAEQAKETQAPFRERGQRATIDPEFATTTGRTPTCDICTPWCASATLKSRSIFTATSWA